MRLGMPPKDVARNLGVFIPTLYRWMPASAPGIDPANGASVYHAVTEANDLCVVIASTPCTDIMSGRPFETTVTVTLNGQTYHGCGETFK